MATENLNQNSVLWNPVLSDTSTTEILHLRCKDHCGRVGADCKSQKNKEFGVRLCLLAVSGVIYNALPTWLLIHDLN